MNAPSPGSTVSKLIARIWHGVTDATRAAIRRFAGEDYEKAHYHPEDRDFLVELEPFVDHYEVIAGD